MTGEATSDTVGAAPLPLWQWVVILASITVVAVLAVVPVIVDRWGDRLADALTDAGRVLRRVSQRRRAERAEWVRRQVLFEADRVRGQR